MSILIKGLKMPKCEYEGVLIALYDDKAYIISTKETKEAVELPDHENLISREALAKELGINDFDCEKCGWYKEKPYPYCSAELDDTCFALENAEIIIPAERSDEWEFTSKT